MGLWFGDDGTGIAASHQARVFEPFFTTRPGHGGSGLGMSISHHIVTAVLGGRIAVSSPPGSGALFQWVLHQVAPERTASVHAWGVA